MSSRQSEYLWTSVPVFGSCDGDSVLRDSAYALFENEGGELAIVRAPDGTFLPGGGIEADESTDEAIRREALEECGLVIELSEWRVRAVQFAHSVSEHVCFEKRSTFVEGRILGSDDSLLEPDHELLWVNPRTAIELLRDESHRWAVGEWLKRP